MRGDASIPAITKCPNQDQGQRIQSCDKDFGHLDLSRGSHSAVSRPAAHGFTLDDVDWTVLDARAHCTCTAYPLLSAGKPTTETIQHYKGFSRDST